MSDKIIEYMKTHRKMITIVLSIVIVVIVFIPFAFYKLPFLDVNSSRLEIAECIAQIIAAIFVALGVFVAVFQYYISSKSEIIRIETDKVNRAINLAEYYKDNVLEPYCIIRNVYVKGGIFDALQKEKKNMKNFDEEEMREIFSDKELDNIKQLYLKPEYLKGMLEAKEIFNININGCTTNSEQVVKGIKKTTVEVDVKKALLDFDFSYVTTLLNNMEQFAMYFTHNIADESVVYQSLFPTYLEMCRTLYYDISKCSPPGQAKLYRNVQKLYVMWNEKSSKTKKIISEHQDDSGTIPDNII